MTICTVLIATYVSPFSSELLSQVSLLRVAEYTLPNEPSPIFWRISHFPILVPVESWGSILLLLFKTKESSKEEFSAKLHFIRYFFPMKLKKWINCFNPSSSKNHYFWTIDCNKSIIVYTSQALQQLSLAHLDPDCQELYFFCLFLQTCWQRLAQQWLASFRW